ncbi:MAG: PAS domain S-box protein [Flavobacterium sp.]
MTILNLIDTIPIPVILLDTDLSIRNYNDLTIDLLDINKEELNNKLVTVLFPEITPDYFRSNFKIDIKHSTSKSNNFDLNIQFERFEYENLSGILYLTKLQVAKERSTFSMRKELVLKQRINIFELFLNNSKEGVFVFNNEGNLLYLNSQASNQFDIRVNKVQKNYAWQIFDFFETQAEWENQKRILNSKNQTTFTLYFKKKPTSQVSILFLSFSHQFINSKNLYIINYTDITESQKDKLVISNQIEQINVFHKNIPAALIQFVVEDNSEHYFTYVSDSFYEMFGFYLSIEDNDWYTFISDYAFDMPFLLDSIKETIKEAKEFKHIGRIRSPKGKVIWIEINAIPTIKEKKIIYNGLILDITERKEVEIENNKKRAFNDSILFSIPADIALFDKDHNYTFINPNAIADSELREWMIGKNDFDYCKLKGTDTKMANVRHDYFLKAIETHKSVDWVDEIVKHGKSIFVLRRFSPFFVEDEFAYMIGYGIDITELKRTQSILSETQRQNELILKSALDAIVIIDKDWKIIFWNPQAEEIFGSQGDEVMGNYLFKTIFPQNDKKYSEEKLKELTSNGNDQILELAAIRKDGKEFPIELVIVPIDDVNNEFHYCIFIRDISNRKEKENEIERQNRVLKSQNIELEQFTYIASHDLQEPLLTLISFSNLLQEEYNDKLDEEGQLFVKFINQSAKRMRSLISGLMEYARINKKEEFIVSDVNLIIQDVLDDLKNTITNSNALIECKSMPLLNCHPTHIRLLFQNLISNAIKFTKKEMQPIIKIKCIEREHDWLFSINDNGIGIDARNVDYIFLIFKRLHNYTEFSGHGIGLAHCKKIVNIHNGEIWVESELGIGSTFYFTISKSIQ